MRIDPSRRPQPIAAPQAPNPATPARRPVALAKATPIPSDWRSGLPQPLRAALVAVEVKVRSFVGGLWHALFPQPKPPDATTPAARALSSFQALQQSLGVPGDPRLVVDHPGASNGVTSVWPFGQVLAAALDVAPLGKGFGPANALLQGLSLYSKGGAYTPDTGGGHRFYDDNAWLGLDLMQAYAQTGNAACLQKAQAIFPFLQQGLDPTGGLRWEENAANPTRNTCSNGPSIELALRLYQTTKDPKYLSFAQNLDGFLQKSLKSPEGLYYDNVDAQGHVSKAIYSYNQGTPIGADVQWFKVTGDRARLDDATRTANAALDYLGQDDRLWKQAPAFNAIFFRNLLALDQVAPNPRYRQVLQQYLDRAWTQARDPQTGLFTRGGIGRYGDHPGDALDQGALVQMYALSAWPADKVGDVG